MMFMNFVEIEGLEPSLTEPESVVLPLHHISIWLPVLIWDCKSTNVLLKCKTFYNILHVFMLNDSHDGDFLLPL